MTQKNVKNLALNVVFASFKGRKKSKFKTSGCQNLVAIETLNHVINKISYQIVAR